MSCNFMHIHMHSIGSLRMFGRTSPVNTAHICCGWSWSLQAVEFLTIDYGMEFCDYYGARCNRPMIETCRVKSVPEIPPSVQLSWLPYKVPLALSSGEQAPAPPTDAPVFMYNV